MFSKKDTMTLDILKTTLPVTLPLEKTGQYYNPYDHNIPRMVTETTPFVYDNYCRISKNNDVSALLRLKGALIIPVTSTVHSHHTFVVIFYSPKLTPIELKGLTSLHQEDIQFIGNSLFDEWYNGQGREFNIFFSRSIFCPRSLQVAQSFADGFTTKETAKKLCVTESGVQYHLDHLRKILGARNRSHMLVELMRKKVIQ
ncbi:helix-turn-helix transcriptional regulator [Sansalvadorimonas verongulae]|uniref:helix-turn-helix transcriptional regulator n=1 Tax=Sansalvadorimonas verongulae TaxID=2172824 RepID=UPI0012BBAB81|nr:helix-turn-helix transcriptional regulator [Sansalvadorimonas verongulae]MTI13970.1 LuxR family transcriptional regulator [Sansalvadorimonas verongulae]